MSDQIWLQRSLAGGLLLAFGGKTAITHFLLKYCICTFVIRFLIEFLKDIHTKWSQSIRESFEFNQGLYLLKTN